MTKSEEIDPHARVFYDIEEDQLLLVSGFIMNPWDKKDQRVVLELADGTKKVTYVENLFFCGLFDKGYAPDGYL